MAGIFDGLNINETDFEKINHIRIKTEFKNYFKRYNILALLFDETDSFFTGKNPSCDYCIFKEIRSRPFAKGKYEVAKFLKTFDIWNSSDDSKRSITFIDLSKAILMKMLFINK